MRMRPKSYTSTLYLPFHWSNVLWGSVLILSCFIFENVHSIEERTPYWYFHCRNVLNLNLKLLVEIRRDVLSFLYTSINDRLLLTVQHLEEHHWDVLNEPSIKLPSINAPVIMFNISEHQHYILQHWFEKGWRVTKRPLDHIQLLWWIDLWFDNLSGYMSPNITRKYVQITAFRHSHNVRECCVYFQKNGGRQNIIQSINITSLLKIKPVLVFECCTIL